MIERMATRLAILVALASCLLASCDTCGPTPAPPAEVPACTGPVTVSVSGGLTPTFTWEPDCMIGKLIVIQGGGGPEDEYWATETRGTNTYRRPIVYGIHPPGAVENQIPQPMTPGDPYTVWVFRWISSHPDSVSYLEVLTHGVIDLRLPASPRSPRPRRRRRRVRDGMA